VTVHVLHENPEWMPPFAAAFAAEGVDWDETLATGGSLDLTAEPPPGLWWSRMSASAHTRGHVAAAEHARALLDLLEAHGRRVVNGRAVLDLELSKVRQLALLRAAGIAVPRTVAVVGGRPDDVLAAAKCHCCVDQVRVGPPRPSPEGACQLRAQQVLLSEPPGPARIEHPGERAADRRPAAARPSGLDAEGGDHLVNGRVADRGHPVDVGWAEPGVGDRLA